MRTGATSARGVWLSLGLLIVAAPLASGDLTIDWYTIDGGGEMWCTGGTFELSGAIGQPDADVVLTGGTFELTGGFWAAGAGAPPPTGACCDPYGGCTVTLEGDCTYPSRFHGSSTDCDPNPCPTWCLGDMDCSGGSPTFDDIKYFSASIGSESAWWEYYQSRHDGNSPPCHWLQGDFSVPRDGVEFTDIKPFAASIGQPCVPYAAGS